ncbi:MAG: outer membrane beta-barrel protein [Deltaproteobacteria bacterium]
MKKIVLFVAAALLVLFSQAAFAAENTGIYVGISGGYVIPAKLNLSNPNDGSWNNYDTTLNNGYLGGVKVGWNTPFTNRILAVELEYNYIYHTFDKDKAVASPSGATTFDGTVNIHAGFVNLKARYPEGRFHPYFGGGLGYSYVKIGDITTGQNNVIKGGSGGAFAYQFLAGLDFDITPNFGVGIGYKYLASKPTIGSAGDAIYSVADYRASIVTLGLTYTF